MFKNVKNFIIYRGDPIKMYFIEKLLIQVSLLIRIYDKNIKIILM